MFTRLSHFLCYSVFAAQLFDAHIEFNIFKGNLFLYQNTFYNNFVMYILQKSMCKFHTIPSLKNAEVPLALFLFPSSW